jgi:hypothetical protein
MKRWDHIEEQAPCGAPGLLQPTVWMHGDQRPDLSDCLVTRIEGLKKSIIVWEPLATKAPGPHLARPWCCYICTVIFYRTPFLTMPPKPWRDREGVLRKGTTGSFFAWDQIETRLNWYTLVNFDGVDWKPGGGRVVWARLPGQPARWWMRHGLRVHVPAHERTFA